MAGPQPQTIASEIEDQLQQLALSAGRRQSVDLLKLKIIRDCDQLQRVDAIAGSLLKANLFALCGDRKQSDYWLKNARKIGAKDIAIPFEEASLYLLGHISEAYKLFDDAFEARGVSTQSIQNYLNKAVSCGWFRKARWVLDHAEKSTVVNDELSRLIDEGVRVVNRLKVTDEQLSAIMDEVHEILRQRDLIWLDDRPQIRVNEQDSLISMVFRIALTPDEAADMNWQLVDRLIETGLDALGVVVTFHGAAISAKEQLEVAMG